jgi:hypothetical protein
MSVYTQFWELVPILRDAVLGVSTYFVQCRAFVVY